MHGYVGTYKLIQPQIPLSSSQDYTWPQILLLESHRQKALNTDQSTAQWKKYGKLYICQLCSLGYMAIFDILSWWTFVSQSVFWNPKSWDPSGPLSEMLLLLGKERVGEGRGEFLFRFERTKYLLVCGGFGWEECWGWKGLSLGRIGARKE